MVLLLEQEIFPLPKEGPQLCDVGCTLGCGNSKIEVFLCAWDKILWLSLRTLTGLLCEYSMGTARTLS